MRLLLLTLIVGLSLSACSGSSSDPANYSLEHKVAIVNARHYVPETDITVKRIRFLLSSLQVSTGYPQEKVADQAAATRNMIREEFGREVTVLDLLEAANKAEVIRTKSVKLEQYFAVYAALAGQ